MNPYDNSGNTNGDGNRGGWEYSDMRAYLNGGKYLEGTANEIDYSSNGIFNSLPNGLQDVIIDTDVVSGNGSNDSAISNTIDKLYLLSTHEVYEDVDGNTNGGIDYYDKSYSYTRQLDYYANIGVTTSNYSGAIKKRIDTGNAYYWWLGSAYSSDGNRFFYVRYTGDWSHYGSHMTYGVSPAFRIG